VTSAPPGGTVAGDRLDSLTGLRFYAACAVLLCHSVLPLFPVPVLRELATIGPVGVGFFFVLSGLVLTWSWQPVERTRDFFTRRGSRIYPLHLATTAVAASLFFADGNSRIAGVVASVLLVQAWFSLEYGEGGHDPTWSLSCEAFFYACFPSLIRRLAGSSRRRLGAVAVIALAVMAGWNGGYAAVTMAGVPHTAWLSTYTNPGYRIGEFVLGMCLGCGLRSGWRPRIDLRWAIRLALTWYGVLAAGNWLFASMGPALSGKPGLPLGALDFLYLPAVVVLVAAAAAADLSGRPPGRLAGRWHLRLGKWSFALYLTQTFVIEAVASTDRGWSAAPDALVWAGTVLACVALSGLLFQCYERPLERMLRARLLRPTPLRPTLPSSVSLLSFGVFG
jgi:peptidoglycan/LPS O-acetylase OafA/YrhL